MCNQSIRIIAVILASTSALLGVRPVFGQVEFTWQGDGGNNNWQNAQNWDQQPGNGDYPNATDHNVNLNNNADRFDVDLSGSTRTVGEFGMASFSDQQYIVFNGLLRLRDLDMSHGPDTGQIFDVGIEQYDAGTWDMNFARIVVNGQLSGSSNILLTGVTINVAAELNNANPYSGQITLEEKLRLGHSLALQNASVVMAANNKLDVNTNSIDATLGALSGTGNLNIGSTAMTVGGRNLTTTFSGNLIGTGSFDKIGDGAMTLSGAISGLSLLRNAGVGDLILTGGGSFQTLFAVDGEILVDGATLDLTNDAGNTLLVRNNAGVQIQGGATVQLTGASGTNRVVIVNDGTLSVSGSGTNLTAPRLDVGPSGSGNASANVLSQATVNVNELRIGDLGSDDGASGAFGIVSNAAVDANDVVFYRRSSLAAIGGPMTIDRLIEGDSAPSHTITISDTAAGAALTVGVNDGDSAFDGLINEGPIPGSIRKEGAGTFELTGANTFTGGVIVNGGTLFANNTTGSATGTGGVIVGAGATFGGTGTAAGTTLVESGGTVAPGVTVGTLRVDNVTFESGSTFAAELVLTTETERLVVSQTATLGGTLRLTSLGSPPFPGTTYVILTANNLVGTFDEVISTDGVTWSVEYDAVTAEVRVVACADEDNDGVCDDDDLCSGFDDNIDADSDGVPDGCDVCPGFDDTMDSDNDGVPNGCDACNGFDDNIDTDGDGVADGCDDCPADNPDDSDGDGVCDSTDACPGFDDNADADGDGAADGCDVCPADNPDDSDGDGVCDSADTCPGFDDNLDTDSDGVADGCDSCTGGDDNVDSDGDGVADFCDACPLDNPDDSDGDGVCDSADACPGFDDNADVDGDGVADGCDPCPADNPDDSDGDGVCDSADACPGFDDNVDADGDGVADGCDACPLDNPDDSDGDGVCDSADACPGGDDSVDGDGDGVADFCDSCPLDNPDDSDGDGVCDSNDACPGGDDNVDTDGDGVPDFCDNCPTDNPDDSDGDGICDSNDVCPGGDDNVDGDGDGVCDSNDACPGFDDNVDADSDGVPDGCDQCPDSPNVHNVSQGTFHATIAQAIAASMQGDVIELGACVFDERDLTLEGHNITIRGQGTAATIVDGQGIAKTILRLQTGDVSTIENLTVQNGVGHLSVGGGAVLVIGAATTPTFRNVAFLNNSSGGNRFGAVSINGGSCLFERCAFRGNSTSDADGASTFAVGGEATATFIDCLFDGETGGAQMGEVAAVEDPAFGRFVNCTFANYDGDRFLYTAGFESSVEILNSVFDTSSTTAIAEFTAAATLFRCVYPGATGDNIDGAPTFVDAASGDYRLAPGSLGIDAADVDAYVVAGGGAIDLNGDPRTYDDVGTVDTGIGALTYLDMGAFEYQGTSTCDDADNDGVCDIDDVCPDFDDLADADGDGIPDGCDVCPNRRIGDVSGDGVVAMDDIAPFVAVMLEPDAATEDEICAVDTNLDGAGNGLDVQAFLGLILGG